MSIRKTLATYDNSETLQMKDEFAVINHLKDSYFYNKGEDGVIRASRMTCFLCQKTIPTGKVCKCSQGKGLVNSTAYEDKVINGAQKVRRRLNEIRARLGPKAFNMKKAKLAEEEQKAKKKADKKRAKRQRQKANKALKA